VGNEVSVDKTTTKQTKTETLDELVHLLVCTKKMEAEKNLRKLSNIAVSA